jgi:hypothetical protein
VPSGTRSPSRSASCRAGAGVRRPASTTPARSSGRATRCGAPPEDANPAGVTVVRSATSPGSA